MCSLCSIPFHRTSIAGNFGAPGTMILALLTAALVLPAAAQTQGTSHRPEPGTLIVLPSNHVGAEATGILAHTNLRLVAPPTVAPGEAPPFAGYGYETPASLACVYRLVAPTPGCNPNSTPNTPGGGSQTIAIVDAFDDPNAAADLAVFSKQFGLPLGEEQFRVVYAQGAKPGTDPSGGWELEEALDIEYAHAMAPHARIYLVEAATNSFNDLFTAVLVATNLVRCHHTHPCPANANGKGEVSMSWGGGEFSTEASFDFVFTGANVVYIAAAGDGSGVIYPSASPNVISAGGTSDSRSLFTGDLIAQTAWSDAGGGLSFFEPTPPYQAGLPASLTLGARATPDVSANSNPSTGVWEYDSFPLAGVSNPSNWWIVGGTSVATQLLAGIINAASTASGHFAASTAAELTEMYSDLTNATTYNADFWDITYGACNYYSGSFSGPGYDLCTGLGSPKGLMGK